MIMYATFAEIFNLSIMKKPLQIGHSRKLVISAESNSENQLLPNVLDPPRQT